MTESPDFDLMALRRVERLIMLADVYQVFREDESRLLDVCRMVSVPGESRESAIRNPEPLLLLFICELHNYLGAVWMLKEHTQTLVDRLYKGTCFMDEYGKKATEVFSIPAAHFLHKLRNYSVHNDIPISGLNWAFDAEGKEIMHLAVGSGSADFRKWTNWDTVSRCYIESFGDWGVDIERAVSAYSEAVTVFYDWLHQRQLLLHSDDLREYARQQAYVEAVERCLSEANRARGDPLKPAEKTSMCHK